MGMHKLNVNGISFSCCTFEQIREAGVPVARIEQLFVELPVRDGVPTGYLYLPNVTRHRVTQAVLSEPSKLDFAVPQEFFDHPDTKARREAGDHPMWYYGNDHGGMPNSGAPVWLSELMNELLSELSEQWARKHTEMMK